MSQPGSSYFVCDKFLRERKFTWKFMLKLSITIATDLERRSIRLAQLFPEPIEVKVDVEWLHGGHNVTGQAQQGRLVQARVGWSSGDRLLSSASIWLAIRMVALATTTWGRAVVNEATWSVALLPTVDLVLPPSGSWTLALAACCLGPLHLMQLSGRCGLLESRGSRCRVWYVLGSFDEENSKEKEVKRCQDCDSVNIIDLNQSM